MRKLIARITGWPLVSIIYGFDNYYRFARRYEDGEWFVIVCGNRKEVAMNNSYHNIKPIMNCRKHGVPLFEGIE